MALDTDLNAFLEAVTAWRDAEEVQRGLAFGSATLSMVSAGQWQESKTA